MQEIWVQPLSQEESLEKGMATTLVFLPGKFQGQRSLAGYSPWGGKESDMTKSLTLILHMWYHVAICLTLPYILHLV